jgi:hypothetical protein
MILLFHSDIIQCRDSPISPVIITYYYYGDISSDYYYSDITIVILVILLVITWKIMMDPCLIHDDSAI